MTKFEYKLPGGLELDVTATVDPGRTQLVMNIPGEPPEEIFVEVEDIKIIYTETDFDVEGLYLQHAFNGSKYRTVLSDIEEAALEAFRNDG